MVNQDGVFQLVDIGEGGFCFRCPPQAAVSDKWVAEILTPIGDIKHCHVEKRWSAHIKNDDFRLPSFVKIGVKFSQLTKEQHSDLTGLIRTFSDDPADSEIDKTNVL